MSHSHPLTLSSDTVYLARQAFFDDLVTEWSRPPELIDTLMGQAPYYIAPDTEQQANAVHIKNVQKGLLVQSFTAPDAWAPQTQLIYSVFHAGDWLRFGVLLLAPPQLMARLANIRESVVEIDRIWDRPANQFVREDSGILLEWRFVEPEFYTNFAVRERFVMIARHLHFRLGRALYDLAQEYPARQDGDTSDIEDALSWKNVSS